MVINRNFLLSFPYRNLIRRDVIEYIELNETKGGEWQLRFLKTTLNPKFELEMSYLVALVCHNGSHPQPRVNKTTPSAEVCA